MLDFRIETFLAVCRHMNFTKAAEELSITQPAVSHHIHYLEEQYETRLFTYQGKKIVLTESGRVFLSAALTMKHDELELKKVIRQKNGSGKTLVFGATMTVGEYVMPEALLRLMEEDQTLSIKMAVADTKELLAQLDRGEIEFAVVEGFFQKKEYDFLVYDTKAFVIVCAPGYRLCADKMRIEDLLGERLFIREPGSGTRNEFERYLEGHNLQIQDFTNLVETSSVGAIKRMVEAGKGITFLYETAVEEELRERRLCKVELEDFYLCHDFTFIWRKGSIFSDYYKKIFRLLRGKVDYDGNTAR